MSARRVLVTGASGFLGHHLLTAMARDASSWSTLALIRDAAQSLPNAESIVGRLDDVARWSGDSRLTNLHGIVHLAAVVDHGHARTDEMRRTNVDGTLAMVRLAAQLGCRMVYLSTSGVVGCFATPAQSADESAPFCMERVGNWPYYASKIEAEQSATALADSLGVELVILRPPVMLGPHDHRGRSTSSVRRVLEGKVPVLFDGGMHFVDIRDVADAILSALRRATPRRVYNLPGTDYPLADFFLNVAALAGITLHAPRVPAAAIRGAARVNSWLGRFGTSVLPDPIVVEMATSYWGLRSNVAAELGFVTRPSDVTLRDTIEWLREQD